MKKILITGANSYIGISFDEYMKNYSKEYLIDTLDMLDSTWKNKDFSGYDVIYHVAGIAHQKETDENKYLYYEVNRDLSIEVAEKAKKDGVKQFIFLSSMSVYGLDTGVITKHTLPEPKSNYGKSKLQAEQQLCLMEDENFALTIIRPPMVYGKNCKGNFQSVIKLVKKLPVFPMVENRRSMIYIDNLSSFVKLCIDKNLKGLFLPQNREYVQTTDMASIIAKSFDKKLRMSALLGLAVKICMPFLSIAQKGFGSLIYKDTDEFDYTYCVVDSSESISKSI